MYTPKQEDYDLIRKNFNAQAYYQAVAKVYEAAARSATYEELVKALDGYDEDTEDDSPTDSFYCEIELDRSRMETETEYVSVEFLIAYQRVSQAVTIETAALFIDDLGGICRFDPSTLEVTEWH